MYIYIYIYIYIYVCVCVCMHVCIHDINELVNALHLNVVWYIIDMYINMHNCVGRSIGDTY